MVASSHRPHGDVGPLLTNEVLFVLADALWDCGQRVSVVHQIHSAPSLPGWQLGVAACSLGRDHAPRRIDLYPAGTLRPLTTIDIHVSQGSDAAMATKLLLGLVGHLTSRSPLASPLPRPALLFPTPLWSPPPGRGRPREIAKTRSPISEPARRCRLCDPACQHRQTVAATTSTARSPAGSAATTTPAQP